MGTSPMLQGFLEARQRKQGLQDQQRDVELQTALQNATSPEDQQAIIHNAYAKDPSHLRQFVEKVSSRLTGKQPAPAPFVGPTPSATTNQGAFSNPETGEVISSGQPVTVTGPAPKLASRQEAEQAFAARGKFPAQQKAELAQQTASKENTAALDYDKKAAQQKHQQVIDLIKQFVPPEQQAKALQEYAQKQAGVKSGVKNLPGAAGQPYKNAQGQWVRPVEGDDGEVTEQPMPAGYAGPQAKPSKPLYKVIRGHAVLLDPNTGAVLKDLGEAAAAKTTTHQTIQYDADNKPHMVTLTSVTVPGRGSIEVDTAPGEVAPKGPAPKKATTGPKAETKPKKDQLDFQKASTESHAANKAVDTAQNAYLDVQKASADPTPVGDQGVILAWLRGRVNRVTNNEIQAVNNLGGAQMKLEGNLVRIVSGKMTDQQRKWFLKSAKDNYDNAKTVAEKYKGPAPQGRAPEASGNVIVVRPEDMK